MAPPTSGAALDRVPTAPLDLDTDFRLDVRVIEGLAPIPALLRSTSDGCGSTCEGACVSFTDDRFEPAA